MVLLKNGFQRGSFHGCTWKIARGRSLSLLFLSPVHTQPDGSPRGCLFNYADIIRIRAFNRILKTDILLRFN